MYVHKKLWQWRLSNVHYRYLPRPHTRLAPHAGLDAGGLRGGDADGPRGDGRSDDLLRDGFDAAPRAWKEDLPGGQAWHSRSLQTPKVATCQKVCISVSFQELKNK